MTETAFALCQKPVIGVVMWLASMCVTNQALTDVYVDLSSSGLIVGQKIDIPMDERYSLFLVFRPDGQPSSATAPTSFGADVCKLGLKERIGSLPTADGSIEPGLSLELIVSTPDGRPAARQRLVPQCSPGVARSNTIGFGGIEMKRGKYVLSIINQYPVALNRSGKVQVIFHGQGAGFP